MNKKRHRCRIPLKYAIYSLFTILISCEKQLFSCLTNFKLYDINKDLDLKCINDD